MANIDFQTNDSQPNPAALHPIKILRLPEVVERVGLKRASIYQHIGQGTFPKQIALGERAVGWIESEIDAWLAERIQARRTIKQITKPESFESTGFQKGGDQ